MMHLHLVDWKQELEVNLALHLRMIPPLHLMKILPPSWTWTQTQPCCCLPLPGSSRAALDELPALLLRVCWPLQNYKTTLMKLPLWW